MKLAVSNITKKYNQRIVVNNISLEIKTGEIESLRFIVNFSFSISDAISNRYLELNQTVRSSAL